MLPHVMMEVMKTLRMPRDAVICRRKLQDLETAKERRRGRRSVALLWGLGVFVLPAFWFFLVVKLETDLMWQIGVPCAFLSILLASVMGIRETTRYMYNSTEDVFRRLAPALADGERCIAYSYGRLERIQVPSWKRESGTYAFFVFTTDRLLCVMFNLGIVGIDQIGKYAAMDKMWLVVSDIKAVDLWDPEALDLGPIIAEPLLI